MVCSFSILEPISISLPGGDGAPEKRPCQKRRMLDLARWHARCPYLMTVRGEIKIMPEPSLELLIQMVQKILESQRDIREDVREIKTRLGRLETEVAQLHVFLAESL